MSGAEPLNRCPECDAPLETISTTSSCPTCGLELDEHSRVWRSQRSWHHHSVRYGLLGLAAGLTVTLGYRLRFGEVPNALLPVAAGVAIAAAGLLLDRILVGRLSGRFVALTPRGVLIGTRRESKLVKWDDVGRLQVRRGRAPKLERRSDGALLSLEDVFDTLEELQAFRAALNDARQRYRP